MRGVAPCGPASRSSAADHAEDVIIALNNLPAGILASHRHGLADGTILGDLAATATLNAARLDVPVGLEWCFQILLMGAVAAVSLGRGHGRVSQGRSTRGRVHRKKPASSVSVLSTADTTFAKAKSRG